MLLTNLNGPAFGSHGIFYWRYEKGNSRRMIFYLVLCCECECERAIVMVVGTARFGVSRGRRC
jgi:hypothetical protein